MSTAEAPLRLIRYRRADGADGVAVDAGDGLVDVTATVGSFSAWLRASAGRVPEALAELRDAAATGATATGALLDESALTLLAPVDDQEIWAAGVTYERSRAARQEEAVDGGDVYARVYVAERPELFYKAHAHQVVAPGEAVGIRSDATWNVPEPELTVVVNPAMEIVAYTLGNDMSSRDIEGANPLYLPQAKVYNRACALGPALLLEAVGDVWPQVAIRIHIERDGATAFRGETHTRNLRRSPAELVAFLGRALDFPSGAALLTGTGVVPPDGFTLAAGDRITIDADGLAPLSHSVVVV
jgi:2-dehydro-3-deoxy-D-arabinonate dehydratase